MYTELIVRYSGILFLFILDLIVHGLCMYPALYLTRTLFYAAVLTRLPGIEYCFIGILVLIQSFLYNGCCGIDLIVMMPLTVLAFYIRNVVDLHKMVHALLAVLGILIHYTVIDYGLMNRSLYCIFNLKSIAIHFIIVLILLYSLLKGSLDNRSKL
jgi:hypothetical protein